MVSCLIAGSRGFSQSLDAPGHDYVYKTSSGVEQHLEIFFPPHHDPTKAKVPGLILFHGGNWEQGSLAMLRFACAYFANRGLVAATADYRMLDAKGRAALPPGESPKQVCVIDGKSAIRWFASHAAELGIDSNRIIVGGGSAGGHISAIATMNPGLADPSDPSDVDPRVAAYVWFNPAFSPDDSKHPEIDILAHLRADLPPTIVMFGDQDEVWFPGWKVAYAKWKSLGVQSIELWIAPGQTHGFFNGKAWRPVTLRAVDDFLVKHGLLSGKSPLPPPAPGTALIPGG